MSRRVNSVFNAAPSSKNKKQSPTNLIHTYETGSDSYLWVATNVNDYFGFNSWYRENTRTHMIDSTLLGVKQAMPCLGQSWN